MPFARRPCPQTLTSLADIAPTPFWLDDPSRPDPAPALTSSTSADLVIVGAGFTGLWAALLAKEVDASRDVIILEAGETASGASGRNGGFVNASLTHGFVNGLERWPNEIRSLLALGHANLNAIESTVARLGIDCDLLRSGELTVATEPYQLDEMRAEPAIAAAYGETIQWFEREETRALVNSSTYLGALYDPSVIMLNPARLAWGLRKACLDAGVRIHESTSVTALEREENLIVARTAHGQVRARRVALATNAFPPLLKRLSHYIVPVYDYALVTEPLSAAQRESIGWKNRQGVGDAGNLFHYYRTTADGRVLWGGYDAIYHWNNGFGTQFETDRESFGRLAEHFFETFPQLEGLRFTHGWGGAIDTSSRFSVFWGTAHRGRVAYALGYTGLGVGASRFGAQVMLDLLDGNDNERTRLQMARSKPLPFPPEPLRSAVVGWTQRDLDQADRNEGRRSLWLRLLDSMGLGFDS
ncbi:MAG: FAD-dependent oxidoreductase [Chloroflexi bacterium]|nr:FAD-dependent oxidoreductase [Chloroflexota bacterium]